MTSPSSFRDYTRATEHFLSTRALEVIVLQASPVLGLFLGGFDFEWPGAVRLGLLFLGSLALTAHVFVLNDWAGHGSDSLDPRRATSVFGRQGISRHQVAFVAIVLLLVAAVALAEVGGPALPLGLAIAVLSFLYSCSPGFGKSTPVMASINHLLGGILHFLLGYTLVQPLDLNGLLIGLFFGLVFAAGHLNQEIRDYDGDRLNGIRTSAVVFGREKAFLASVLIFTAAYVQLAGLAMLGVLPKILLGSTALWPLQAAWSLQAFRRGLGFETASWLQQRYRLLFAIIGFMMLLR